MRVSAARSRRSSNDFRLPRTNVITLAANVFLRLEHLQNVKDPNKQGRIVRSLRNALGKIEDLKNSPQRLRRSFLEKYKVAVRRRGVVEFTLPKGVSVLDLLREAQTISYALRGVVAVYPPRLTAWSKGPSFNKKSTRLIKLIVTAYVPGSEFKSRKEQVLHLSGSGMMISEARELAAAHAIFSVFRNKPLADLFNGNIIRVKGTKLYYGNGGLSEMDESDYVNSCSYKNLKMASTMRR